MTIDSLAFLGDSIFGHSIGVDSLLARLETVGIERAVVAPFKPRGYHLQAANDVVAEAVRSNPGRIAGLVRVDPLLGDDAIREAERGLGDMGLRGIFLHPWEETFPIDDPRVDSVVEVAGDRRVPVVIASGYPWLSEGLQVGQLAGRFPDVAFVATNGLQLNMSGLGQTDAELALSDNPNLSVQTTGVYRQDFIEHVVATFGAERVLFAGGSPQFDPALEARRVKWAAFSEEQKQLVLERNAARLFGLAPSHSSINLPEVT